MNRRAVSVFIACCVVILALGVAESLIDGDAPWAFLGFAGWEPHRLAARILDVPRVALSLVAIAAWTVVIVGWVKRMTTTKEER